MGLETGTYISSLNASNPTSGDNASQGDDHIRLIKSTILATFPNLTGAVTPTQDEINVIDGSINGTWTPTITAQSGTITSSTLTAATYTRIGRQVTASATFTITNAGTATQSLYVTLPFTNMAQAMVGSGYEGASTGNLLWVLVGAGDNKMQIRNYNNTTCIATNAQIIATVTYFV